MHTSNAETIEIPATSSTVEIKQIQEIVKRITEEYLKIREDSNKTDGQQFTLSSFGNDLSSKKLNIHSSGSSFKKRTGSTLIKEHFSDFWNNISLPGFKYVGQNGGHTMDRYFWFSILIVSIIISSKYVENSYRKWQASPFLLSFNDSLTPISAIPFPAVTICSPRQLSNRYDLDSRLKECQSNDTCSPEQWDQLSAAGLLCPSSQEFPKSMDAKYYGGSVDSLLKQIISTCGEDMTWFKLNGDEYSYNCSSRFQTIFVDGKVCFSFNMLPARDLFHAQVISPMVDRTDVVSKINWTLDSMIGAADLSQTVPRYIHSNGRWAGLYFEMEKASDFVSSCKQSDRTVKMVFHHPAEIPQPDTHKFYDLPPTGDLFISLLPNLVTASDELIDYTPTVRKCYFSHEKRLSLFRVYTQRNCQLECRVNCSLSLCDCVPYYLPRINDSVRICGRQHTLDCAELYLPAILGGRYTWREIVQNYRQWVGDRIQKLFEEYEYSRRGYGGSKPLTSDLLETTYPDCECDCPPACTLLRYDVDISAQPLPDYLGIQVTRPAISFKEPEFTSVVRKELIGLTDFIANSGGVLGVFTGFTFLALIELLYYLTLRLWNKIKHSWNEENNTSDFIIYETQE